MFSLLEREHGLTALSRWYYSGLRLQTRHFAYASPQPMDERQNNSHSNLLRTGPAKRTLRDYKALKPIGIKRGL